MSQALRAIEFTGSVDESGAIHPDTPLVGIGPAQVRVLILVTEENDPEEREWLTAASRSDAYAFLDDPAEDIYSLSDGKPFHGTR